MNKKYLKFELDLDFILVAITAQLRDYRLCHHINKTSGVSFSKDNDLEIIYHDDVEPVFYSRYVYQKNDTSPLFYFISNKGSRGYLIPEMKKTDYFIIIKNFIDQDDLNQFITKLNQVKDILVAVEVNPKKVKSKENLVF